MRFAADAGLSPVMFARVKKFSRRLPRILRKGRVEVVLAFAAGVFLLLGAERSSSTSNHVLAALERLELLSHDAFFRWRGARPPDPQIAVVGIMKQRVAVSDVKPEELAASEPLQWMSERDFPWRRSVYAALIEKLIAAGAKVIVFDLIFAAESQDDALFRETIAKYRDQIVLASTVQEVSGEDGKPQTAIIEPVPGLLPEDTRMVGYAFHHPGADGVIRRVDYRTSALREHRPDLVQADDPRDMIGLAALAVEKLTGQAVPPGVRVPIDFQGPARTYPYLPIEELFIDSIFQGDPRFAGGAAFRDKIVFVGPIFELAHDVHATPFGAMPGVEIHAQIAGALLQHAHLRDAKPSVALWSTVGMLALASGIVLGVRRAWLQSAWLITLGAAYIWTSYACFVAGGLLLANIPPLFALICTGSFGIVFHFAIEQSERARIRGVLDKYVSKNVANVVVENSDAFEQALRGEKKCVTVLFSDVRNFTSISEAAEADHLVGQMNEYFLPMVDAVLREGGTLQKFIGDAILAVWGDTHSLGPAVDTVRAIRTALTMRTALARLNEEWRGRPARVAFASGTGINHGEVVVGEIGHPQRMEFTVLGDGVNLAARLESATKQFHTDILVGEKAEALTRGEFVYRRVDRLRFKGKARPVEVFIPLSDSNTAPPPWLGIYHGAIDRYRAREFAAALTAFEEVQAALGAPDFLCEMYLRRCAGFLQTPPDTTWDGTHTLSDK